MRRLIEKPLNLCIGLLLIAGLGLLGAGLYIPAKALLAQALLERAWQRTLDTEQASKPWPWADTFPVARLRARAHNVDLIVLDGEQGNSLAFAPGLHPASEIDRQSGTILISAHRDTHFHFLKDIQIGEQFELQNSEGETTQYRVEDVQVVNLHETRLISPTDGKWLVLVTCYPFDSLRSDPQQRFVVMAEALEQTDEPEPMYAAKSDMY